MSENQRRYKCILTVYSWLRDGLSPAAMIKKQVFSKRQIQYALDKMRSMGIIRKVGYGTWEILIENVTPQYLQTKKVQKVHRVGRTESPPQGTKPDSVRSHGIVVTLRIPTIPRWEQRESILEKSKIPMLKIAQGQRVKIGEIEKVWLCNKSIIYYLPWSWYADTAKIAAYSIIEDVTAAIVRTEKYLGIKTLKVHGSYKIKFSRQHHALIKNALAKMYNRPGKRRLQIRDDNGLWLLIDNSSPDGKVHLNEFEAVHPKTAPDDNKLVQDHFNDIKANPGLTPSFIADSLGKTSEIVQGLAQEQEMYRKDLLDYGAKIAAHAKSIEQLGTGISEMTGLVREIAKDREKQASKRKYITF